MRRDGYSTALPWFSYRFLYSRELRDAIYEKKPLVASFIQFSVHERDALLVEIKSLTRKKLNFAAESIKALAKG